MLSFTTKQQTDIAIANINIGFAIRFNPIPQERKTVISDERLSLLSVITVANKTPSGIVITMIDGRFKMTILNATENGIPNIEICLISVIKVSEAKIIDVKIQTPIINTSITCERINLSRSFIFSNRFCQSFNFSKTTRMIPI